MQDVMNPLERLVERAEQLMQRIESVLPQPLQAPADWSAAIAWRYRKRANGCGVLEPVRHVGAMQLSDLQNIDGQKDKIARNTEQFVQGRTANNVLLTGARGTGKSSLIRACLHAYAPQGLRLIEVDKADLTDLPDIVDVVAGRPEKFIIYCDDLSFEEGEPGYKAMKSILDGSVSAATPNVLVYATSNRRHLLPEYMSDNLQTSKGKDGEIHPVRWWRRKSRSPSALACGSASTPSARTNTCAWWPSGCVPWGCLTTPSKPHEPEALVWALERGSRSGRVAQQFARDYAGRNEGARRPRTNALRMSRGLTDGAEISRKQIFDSDYSCRT